jgi:hypothetical protein
MAQAKRQEDQHAPENPKIRPDPNSNQLKDPDDWVTGHEPITVAQASYLKHYPKKRTTLMPLTLISRSPKRQSASTS